MDAETRVLPVWPRNQHPGLRRARKFIANRIQLRVQKGQLPEDQDTRARQLAIDRAAQAFAPDQYRFDDFFVLACGDIVQVCQLQAWHYGALQGIQEYPSVPELEDSREPSPPPPPPPPPPPSAAPRPTRSATPAASPSPATQSSSPPMIAPVPLRVTHPPLWIREPYHGQEFQVRSPSPPFNLDDEADFYENMLEFIAWQRANGM